MESNYLFTGYHKRLTTNKTNNKHTKTFRMFIFKYGLPGKLLAMGLDGVVSTRYDIIVKLFLTDATPYVGIHDSLGGSRTIIIKSKPKECGEQKKNRSSTIICSSILVVDKSVVELKKLKTFFFITFFRY